MKFYAVKVGRMTGVFKTWDECKKQVMGYKGAIYKSFGSYEEAESFVAGSQKLVEKDHDKLDFYAYIDGSFDRVREIYGSGAVIVENGKKTVYKKAGSDKEISKLHNVAGEIEAAKYVMGYAKDNKLEEITLFYDYRGIEAWATEEWKANLPYTKEYAEFYKKISKDVKVNFVKVKAHSGVELNELVDDLAKQSIVEYRENFNEDFGKENFKSEKDSSSQQDFLEEENPFLENEELKFVEDSIELKDEKFNKNVVMKKEEFFFGTEDDIEYIEKLKSDKENKNDNYEQLSLL